MIKMDFRLSFHLNTCLFGQNKTAKAVLQKKGRWIVSLSFSPRDRICHLCSYYKLHFLVHFPILLLKLEDMISYHLSSVSKWEGKLLILLLQYSQTGQLHYIAPAYLSLVRMLFLCIKDLPVKYFHTSCSQKVTKYFPSSLISSNVCMNSLATPYPFLEVHCVSPLLTVQLSKLFVVPWRGDALRKSGAQF